MRAAVLYDVNDVRIEERAVPELRDGELLVRTMASGICSGDVMGWYVARKARRHRGGGRRRLRALRGRSRIRSSPRAVL